MSQALSGMSLAISTVFSSADFAVYINCDTFMFDVLKHAQEVERVSVRITANKKSTAKHCFVSAYVALECSKPAIHGLHSTWISAV